MWEARTAGFAVRVFSAAIMATAPYSTAVSKLRDPDCWLRFGSGFFLGILASRVLAFIVYEAIPRVDRVRMPPASR